MDGLYDRDALEWAEQQAGLLARLAAGERVNALVDWAHVIEEVRDVGLSELKRVESLLVQAMTHLMKMHRWPEDIAMGHWESEVVAFLLSALRSYTPSMRRRLSMDDLFEDARRQFVKLPGAATSLPDACPYDLRDLLDRDADPATLAQRLRPA